MTDEIAMSNPLLKESFIDMTGSGEDKTKEKLEHCVLYSHDGASVVFSVKWL